MAAPGPVRSATSASARRAPRHGARWTGAAVAAGLLAAVLAASRPSGLPLVSSAERVGAPVVRSASGSSRAWRRPTRRLASYGQAEYWNTRFRTRDKGPMLDQVDDRTTGWVCDYHGPLRETLQAVIGGDTSKRILNIGCGVDLLSENIYQDGFHNIISTDIAPSAIEEMRARTANSMPDADWLVDDAREMSLPSASIDVIVDKGVLDSVLTDTSAPVAAATKLLGEAHRVLRVGGTFLLATHGRGDAAAFRLPLLGLPHLSFDIHGTDNLGGYYIFVCVKTQEPTDETEKRQQALEWAEEADLKGGTAEAEALALRPSAPQALRPPSAQSPAAAPAAPAAVAAEAPTDDDYAARLEAAYDAIDWIGQ